VHGSPGGSDQGALMGAFLADAGYRVIAPSGAGYLDTPLTDHNGRPDEQAEIPGAEILRVEDGTHVCVWTDPTSDAIQARIVDFLCAAGG
jgi:pimeloyl-ACP methyl ester carboxylesterase